MEASYKPRALVPGVSDKLLDHQLQIGVALQIGNIAIFRKKREDCPHILALFLVLLDPPLGYSAIGEEEHAKHA